MPEEQGRAAPTVAHARPIEIRWDEADRCWRYLRGDLWRPVEELFVNQRWAGRAMQRAGLWLRRRFGREASEAFIIDLLRRGGYKPRISWEPYDGGPEDRVVVSHEGPITDEQAERLQRFGLDMREVVRKLDQEGAWDDE